MTFIFADVNNKTTIQECLSQKLTFNMYFTSDEKQLENILNKYNKTHDLIISFNEKTNKFLKEKKIKYGEI